jgi:CHASE2 domain-containing sensor protein
VDPSTLELLKSFAGLGSVVLVVPAVQAVKGNLPTWPGWAWPLLALAFAMLLNVIVAVAMRSDLYVAIAVGVGTGFLAMIAYDKSAKPEARG